MAEATVMNGTSLLINVGDPGGTTFTHPCLINAERGIAFTSTTNDVMIPDCADPEKPAWIGRAKDGLSASITGAGVLDTPSLDDFWVWFQNENARIIKVKINVAGTAGGGTWTMDAHLTAFSVTGNRGSKAAFDCTILSDGSAVWTDAP
jgi:hypothetical protein